MRHLLEGGTYSGINVQGAALVRGRRLYETRHLLDQIRQQYNQIHNSTVFVKQMVWQTGFIFTFFVKYVKETIICMMRSLRLWKHFIKYKTYQQTAPKQKGVCAEVFYKTSFLKVTLWYMCFGVTFGKYLRTPPSDCF